MYSYQVANLCAESLSYRIFLTVLGLNSPTKDVYHHLLRTEVNVMWLYVWA